MNKIEAKEIIGEFLRDSDKIMNANNKTIKTPLRKAFDKAYESLSSEVMISIKESEIDVIMQSIISSCVDTSNELQDRVLNILESHKE